ncbi:response regulator [Pseudomonas veronii]|jgi:hypothetical protein|uniref:Response regulator n=3 Tax=Pseudomonas veronii TaxID=76761 RepID=A0A7Y1FCN7_PSEVE|nr:MULTISPECIES: response regulator [Pseudomonas]NMY13433.1 response regulator [Pseudomonas veronii]PUB37717.1 hypothetical protein C8K66_101423 [Pseudomonas sp. GV105]UHH33082.1 response regulator [Pseudomonas veronii]SBW80922.1 hypothetical protein PVE_R1G3038 [Pseudomonas veronii 1YdBTEX2]
MIHKSSRILIADEQHFFRLRIERVLNQLGYHRIAPVQSITELRRLVDYAYAPFDVLILNEKFSNQNSFAPLAFCLDSPQILSALIYGSEKLVAGSVIRCGKVTICDATFVDRAELQWIISSTDNSIPVQDTVRYPY